MNMVFRDVSQGGFGSADKPEDLGSSLQPATVCMFETELEHYMS